MADVEIHRKGRGAGRNPANRFERLSTELDLGALDEEERRAVPTLFLTDATKSVLSENKSPDVGFRFSLNPYRGCEHGCVYCYSRPSHEYLGFSAGLDFETRIVVKHEAPRLLAEAFEHKNWEPQVVAMSGNTDPYQPAERKLQLTRQCLEVFQRFGNPVSIITKNHLVTRDIDILSDMAKSNLVNVHVSITSLKDEVTGKMEPRTSRAVRRLDAIRQLSEAGIPTGVMAAPVIPGLTDEEMPAILEAAYEHGARRAGYIVVRLPGAVLPIFQEWVQREYPLRAGGILSRIRSLRGGQMNDPQFGVRMRGTGHWAELMNRMFKMTTNRLGMNLPRPPLETAHFRRSQGELF
jgi:DNA repair photolyase